VHAIIHDGRLEIEIKSKGLGTADAFITGLRRYLVISTEITKYQEDTAAGKARVNIGLRHEQKQAFGTGIDTNISLASIKAILNAVNQF